MRCSRSGERLLVCSRRAASVMYSRYLRLSVTERVLAGGDIDTPIELDEVDHALAIFADHGVDSIAVCFLHAYANPIHELEAEERLRLQGFDGGISLSHRVSGEYR